MTNLQAIDLLKGLEQSLDDYCELNDEGKTAFGMAITALELFGNSEQLPSAQPKKRTENTRKTHSCDCISRQAAIDALEKVAELFPWRIPGDRDSYDNYNEAWNDAIGRAEMALEELPSAQAKVVRCKECDFWGGRQGRMYCYEMYFDQDDPDFYCGYVRRKIDG